MLLHGPDFYVSVVQLLIQFSDLPHKVRRLLVPCDGLLLQFQLQRLQFLSRTNDAEAAGGPHERLPKRLLRVDKEGGIVIGALLGADQATAYPHEGGGGMAAWAPLPDPAPPPPPTHIRKMCHRKGPQGRQAFLRLIGGTPSLKTCGQRCCWGGQAKGGGGLRGLIQPSGYAPLPPIKQGSIDVPPKILP